MFGVAATPTRKIIWFLVPAFAIFAQPGLSAAHAVDAGESARTAGLLRAHWDYPAKASLGFGIVAARMPANFECQTPCLFKGVTIQGAAGLGAGELAIGYGSLVGETGEAGTWLLRHVYVGYGMRAAVVRTWGASTLDPHGATFLGAEGAMTIAQFGLRLGLFHRVEPVSGESDWRIFGGAGWGF
jgi:hypothetical protein